MGKAVLKSLLLLVLLSYFFAGHTSAETKISPAKKELIRKILEVTKAKEMIDNFLEVFLLLHTK